MNNKNQIIKLKNTGIQYKGNLPDTLNSLIVLYNNENGKVISPALFSKLGQICNKIDNVDEYQIYVTAYPLIIVNFIIDKSVLIAHFDLKAYQINCHITNGYNLISNHLTDVEMNLVEYFTTLTKWCK